MLGTADLGQVRDSPVFTMTYLTHLVLMMHYKTICPVFSTVFMGTMIFTTINVLLSVFGTDGPSEVLKTPRLVILYKEY